MGHVNYEYHWELRGSLNENLILLIHGIPSASSSETATYIHRALHASHL